MSENARRISDGESVKIGTCRSMYYLRADQLDQVTREANSLDPHNPAVTPHLLFRFPFPQEDGIAPGDFAGVTRGLSLYGADVPDGVDHSTVQFSSNHPTGLLVSLPCPDGAEGKDAPYKVHRNGYAGPVKITAQRAWEGALALVAECGSCGAAYRYPTLEDAAGVLAALDVYVARALRDDDKTRGDYYTEVARRIREGYTNPPAWAAATAPALATV